jgi:hypothetical protein
MKQTAKIGMSRHVEMNVPLFSRFRLMRISSGIWRKQKMPDQRTGTVTKVLFILLIACNNKTYFFPVILLLNAPA